jgi:hypothetical protein
MTTTEPLRYAADITRADVDALDAFMTAWLHELRLEHRHDPEISRVAYGLNAAISWHLFELRRGFEADDGSAEALKARSGHWNELCRITAGWRETEGYNAERWQQVPFLGAQDAAESASGSELDIAEGR